MTETIDRGVIASLSDSVGEDFVGELIDTFTDEAPGMLQEMHQALSLGDAESFRRAAHSLKTNAKTFGATQLAEKAMELETMAREKNLEIGDRLDMLEIIYNEAVQELKSLQ
jgi:HPt (histidine-containing phosphotransfer) domain-containing protein